MIYPLLDEKKIGASKASKESMRKLNAEKILFTNICKVTPTGSEVTSKSSVNLAFSPNRDAKNDAILKNLLNSQLAKCKDRQLLAMVAAWKQIPKHIREDILALSDIGLKLLDFCQVG